MELRFYVGSPNRKWGPVTKMWRVMRLMALFLFIACMQVSAATHAQTVTLSAKNESLVKVFEEIRRQTGYEFLCNVFDLQKAATVTVDIKNAPIGDVLAKIFRDQPLAYTIMNEKTIVVRLKAIPVLPAGDTSRPQGPTPPADIHGYVVDSAGNPLAGATVLIKKLNRQGATNMTGEFVLKGIPSGKYELEITFVGYEKVTRIINVDEKRGNISIEMKRVNKDLDETVIKGYYNTTERENTGDVTTIKADVIERAPVTNVLGALEGQVPGMFVQQANGVPGGGYTVQIRGTNSIANGNNPLYIVDGVPIITSPQSVVLLEGGQSAGVGSFLNYFNPGDIESISVLKDADATAIYGSRGANGVVLIKTKSGKAGRTSLSGSFTDGFALVADPVKWMTTPEFLKVRHQAYAIDSISTIPSNAYDINGTWDTTRSTNWRKSLAGQTANYTNAMMAFTGGSGNVQYDFDGNYHRETTVFPQEFSDQKVSFRLSTSGMSNDQKAKFSVSTSYLADNNKLPNQDPTGMISLLAPDAPPPYLPDGQLNWANNTWTNPYSYFLQHYKSTSGNLVGSATVSYEFLPGLILSATGGYNHLELDEASSIPLASFSPAAQAYAVSSASFTYQSLGTWNLEPQLSYNRNLGHGKLSALVGTTFNESMSNAHGLFGSGYSNDALLGTVNGASFVSAETINDNDYKYTSVYGRMGYDLEQKYILNLTARRDGSSRFGPGRQFADFGAAGAAWIFSNESFLKGNKVLTLGKLRGSYGITGNDQIGDYNYLPLYSLNPGSASTYMQSSYLIPQGIYNADYAWEVNKKLEGAVELGFWGDRVLLTGSFYRNRSSNQLLNYPLSSVTGTGSILENIPAKVENRGWEFTLRTINVRKRNFTWASRFNLTVYRNRLLSYPQLEQSSYAQTLELGKSLHIVKVFQGMGVNDTTGLYQFRDAHGTPTYTPADPTDRTATINLDPKFYGGFENTLTYKSWSLSLFFTFVKQVGQDPIFGGQIYPGYPTVNIPEFYMGNYWQKTGDHARYQRPFASFSSQAPVEQSYAQSSTIGYTNASYVRLSNLYFSYDFKPSTLKAIGFQSIRLFVQGQNLMTLTSLKMDPESKSVTSTSPLRVITGGIKFGL
jgi:TonB-dependent starch-binding outer membrane protein SusC